MTFEMCVYNNDHSHKIVLLKASTKTHNVAYAWLTDEEIKNYKKLGFQDLDFDKVLSYREEVAREMINNRVKLGLESLSKYNGYGAAWEISEE